ncbi:MAG: hypothetical protein IT381_02700 [Deltaproteobacteria bacterium]|nr:hypothetical protein [Deltaproteobacteria bacterium]
MDALILWCLFFGGAARGPASAPAPGPTSAPASAPASKPVVKVPPKPPKTLDDELIDDPDFLEFLQLDTEAPWFVE